ncbi:MAG: DNA-binding CsgD family transcriptional regulator [Bacteroidia bacterium]|jgi:DNA-binding CsgD family transcriptional regulator
MKIDASFSELLGYLYEGPLEDPPWQSFLGCLREHLQADLVTLLLRPPSLEEQVVMLADGGSLSAIQSYNQGQFVLDPFVDLPHAEVVCLHEYLSTDALLESDFYRVIMQPQGWYDFMGIDLREKGVLDVRFRVGRYVGGKAFGRREKDILGSLLPHLERSIVLQQRISRTERERAVYAGAVEQLQVATVILDETGKALSSNAAAQQLLETAGAIVLTEGELQLANRAAHEKFCALLKQVRHSRCAAPLAVHAMQVPTANDSSSLGLVVRAIAPPGSVEGRGMPSVVVFISDPEQAIEPERQAVVSLFGLTPTEARLSLYLAKGQTLDEAAQGMQVSRNTARAHLRAVFSKTGVTRQSGLVRLILSSVAPLAGEG